MKHLLSVSLSLFLLCSFSPVSQADPFNDNGSQTPVGSSNIQQERARIHTELGAGFFQRGQYAIALNELHTALSANSSYAPAYDVLGLVHMALGENDKADKNFRRAIDLAPGNPDFHNNYGWFLYSVNRLDEAQQQYALAIADPLYSTPQLALYNAGLCAIKQGNQDKAIEFFERSLQRDDNQPQAIYQLANLYYQKQRYQDARNLIDHIGSPATASAPVLWLSLRIARRMNDHETETSDALQLNKRFPASGETRLLQQGKFD